MSKLVEEIILKVTVDDSGLVVLGKKAKRTEKKIKAVGDEAKKTGKKFKGAKADATGFSGALNRLAGAASIGVATAKLIDLGKEAITVSRSFERLRLSLETTFGGQAPAQMEFLRSEAERLGVDLRESAKGFASLAASTKGVLTLKETQELFSATAEASTALGLSADRTGMLLKALSQIASKGTLSAEELRQQMGEHLPGAFKLAADSMGVTTQELNKMLEKGEITAKEFLPRFTKELEKTFHKGAMKNASSEIAQSTRNLNRWNNMLSKTGDQLKKITTPATTLFLDSLPTLINFTPLGLPLKQLLKAFGEAEEATNKIDPGSKFDDAIVPITNFTKWVNLSKDAIDKFATSVALPARLEDVRLALGLSEEGFKKIHKEVVALSKETKSTHALIGAAEDLVKVLKEADKLKEGDFLKTKTEKEIEALKNLKEIMESIGEIIAPAAFGLFGENLGKFGDIDDASQSQAQAPKAGLELGTAAAAEFLVRPTEDTNKIAKQSLDVEKKSLEELKKQSDALENLNNIEGVSL